MVESSRRTKCLMQDQRIKPVSANDCSTSDEASKLDLYLQNQLEEDIARIFDESIYSDLEVVCGKLKLLTHSCILKARTNKFYNKLEAILHVNIGKEVFDEIYSFISDAYTECNIKNQEKEILIFLKGNIITKGRLSNCNNTKDDIEDVDVFLTPNSTSPYTENKHQQISCLSPSTDLTKEYYALVHIEGNLLDQELIEQDALSDAFHTIIKSQETESNKTLLHNKPTSLSLVSSHSSNTIKHSSNCDIFNKELNEHAILNNCEKKTNNNQFTKIYKPLKILENNLNNGTSVEKFLDPTFSPDSLITDDPSSSSDYLSAAYAYSPALGTSSCYSQFNVGENSSKMENIFTSSDSGLENTGMLESISSHKEMALTDTSLTETYNISTDETCHLQASTSSLKIEDIQAVEMGVPLASSSLNDTSMSESINRQKKSSVEKQNDSTCVCSKEEKQRQNEDIVILESSTVSSESGSWESVFPPKLTDKEICDKFIRNERQYQAKNELVLEKSNYTDYQKMEKLLTKYPAPCFIDAANLADEELVSIPLENSNYSRNGNPKSDIIRIPSKPVPCAIVNKIYISPGDWSEGNDNEDSLEHGDTKDSDSMQRDLSPTIFKMNLTGDEFLNTSSMSDTKISEVSSCENDNIAPHISSTDYINTTPHNSMISLTTLVKKNETKKIVDDVLITGGNISNFRKGYESTPISFKREPNQRERDDTHSPHSPFIRKTENVSIPGTSFSNEEITNLPKKSKSVYTSAWVVDMSNHSKITESEKFAPNLCNKLGDRICENLKNERKTSNSDNCKSRSSINSDSSEKSGHKFFIDLSTLPDPLPPEKPMANNIDSQKKSMFSMYIDLGANSSCKYMPTRLSSSFHNKIPNKSTPKHKTPKPLSNEKKSDISLPPDDLNNTSELILDCGLCDVGNVDCLNPPLLKEDKTCSETGNTTSNSIILPRLESGSFETMHNQTYEVENGEEPLNLTDDDIYEFGNKGEKESLLDKSFTVADPKITFEQYESLCSDPNISISEIIATPETVLKSANVICESESIKIEKPINKRVDGDKIVVLDTVIREESNNSDAESGDLFVKLSDLDKPTQKCDKSERERLDSRMTRSIPDNNWLGHNVQTVSFKSSEVISSFHSENALSLNRLFPHLKNEFSKSMPVSLSGRTRSPLRPGAPSSVGELDEQVSDVSDISSVPSSMCRSVIENSTTEETSQTSRLINNCQSRLGQDLLRMFLEEIAPDVIVEVPGKRIKAHKCILSSRCPYFAGILSGGWVESGGNVISLPPFSYNVVHFALCHIYSGIATIPDSISIVELATLADMLSLEGLKEAIMFTLKAKYCHHFHEPCQVCTVGVLECFPLSSAYGLDDLYRKCLRWITKYFAKVWPTKAFATLPRELLDKCYQEHVVNLSIENLFDTVYGCGITVASLQNSRWAESVARMCRRLVNSAAQFAAARLLSVLEMLSTTPDAPQAASQALEDCLAVAIEWAPPDETCRAYAYLSCLIKDIRNLHPPKLDLVTKLPESKLLITQASSWRLQCEGALVRAAPRVVGTQAFKDLPPDLRKRLRELGCISYSPQTVHLASLWNQEAKIKNPYHKQVKKAKQTVTRSLDIENVRNTFVPYKPVPMKMESKGKIVSNTELRDIKKNKVDMLKVRMTKAQEKRTTFNRTKSLSSQNNLTNKPISHRSHPFENTKPRYLESRTVPKESQQDVSQKKLVNKVISSSESSRNSSPIQSKILRNNRCIDKQKCERHAVHAMSQDSLATTSRPRTAEPSTDSLSESQTSNKYATYTKTKHTNKGSVESVISKCQGIPSSSLQSANLKTKIPIYLNQYLPSENNRQAKSTCARLNMPLLHNQNQEKSKPKSCDRRKSGFQNATKASSAKVVPRVPKESQMCHSPQNKSCKQIKTPSKQTNKKEDERKHGTMERSGTFLKDKPTFGDKTTNIDKSQ